MDEQWEYLREKDPNDDTLNSLGEQGWELVAIIPPTQSQWEVVYSSPVYVFKRRTRTITAR